VNFPTEKQRMQEKALSPVVEPEESKKIPDFSAVLVCWNNREYLEPCLKSLYDVGLQSSFDVVVVDNGSTDGSQAMLHDKFPGVKLIQNQTNLGLGKASNQGIEASRGRYILLLNNDTLITDHSLDRLVNFMDAKPDAGAVGGKLLNPDGTFQGGSTDFPTLLQEAMIATHIGELLWDGYPSHGRGSEIREVGWLSSACLLVRRAALDVVGLLDESYFIYGDEADLQYRLQDAGWKVYYLPDVSIIHYGGRSMDRWRRRKMVYRGKMLFFRKNYGRTHTAILRVILGSLSFGKLLAWSSAWLVPGWRERAVRELSSNKEVIGLCWRLE